LKLDGEIFFMTNINLDSINGKLYELEKVTSAEGYTLDQMDAAQAQLVEVTELMQTVLESVKTPSPGDMMNIQAVMVRAERAAQAVSSPITKAHNEMLKIIRNIKM
jgi:hypothetical protein